MSTTWGMLDLLQSSISLGLEQGTEALLLCNLSLSLWAA